MEKQTNTKIQRIKTTCLWGCFGLSCSCLSFPVIFLLSLCLNPRSQQPLRSNAPTLPASPIPILMWISQLAARAWSKPADRCHKTEEGEGERKTRTEMEKGGRSRAFPLSSFSGRQKRSDRKGFSLLLSDNVHVHLFKSQISAMLKGNAWSAYGSQSWIYY